MTRRNSMVYILIAVPIVLFNLIAIFGPDVLIGDDAISYSRVINGHFLILKYGHRIIGGITHGLTSGLLTLSPELVRAFYLLFVLVPLSCLFYYFYQKKMGFPQIVAYSAAVLPNILPGQYHIPAFTDGTHVALGLLVIAACFFTSFFYLDNQGQKNWKMLLKAVFIYLLATQITDQTVFFFPVLLFAILGYHKLTRKHLFLAVSLFLVFLHKCLWMLLLPRSTTKMMLRTFTEMAVRAEKYFLSWLPVPKLLKGYGIILAIVFFLVVITGLVLHIKNRNAGFHLLKPFTHLSHKTFTYYLYGFFFIWVVSNIIAFIAVSPKGFLVRYGYAAAYGLNALLVLSLYPILKTIFREKDKLISLMFSVIILISGVSRVIELKAGYEKLNTKQAKIIEYLKQYEFPGHSQIVLFVTKGANYWGSWRQSSGHLKFMLKRDDIDGLIGDKRRQYFSFYDPFNTVLRVSGKKGHMRGIDIKRPLFLFVEENKKFKQYQYALQWKEEAGEPEWTIFHFDKQTGKASSVITGKGIDDYYSALKDLEKKGIRQEDILWGGPARNPSVL